MALAQPNEAVLKRTLRELRRESAEWTGLEEGTLETTETLLATLFSEVRNLPQPRFELDGAGVLVSWRCLWIFSGEITYYVEGSDLFLATLVNISVPTTLKFILAEMRRFRFVNHGVPKGKLKAL